RPRRVRMSRKLAGLATILILLFSFGTVFAQSDSNTIVVGISSDIQNLDPHNFRHRYTETVLRNIYDGLVTRGPDMVPVPELAESIVQIDPTTRSEEHTSELQSRENLVCRLLLE